jgi:putative tricarboxylic transport membrane protein
MAGLVEKLKADPGAVSWAGGSAGGTDHITAGLIAKAVGVDPTKINYIAFSGGGEALAAILGNQVTVGISGYGEFAAGEGGHDARHRHLLADEGGGHRCARPQGSGLDVNVQNWRMVAAAPGHRPSRRPPSSPTSRSWPIGEAGRSHARDQGLGNTYLAGDAFDAQLAKDIEATAGILKDIGLVK